MRDSLKTAVRSAISFECRLPHEESGILKSCLSSHDDRCFSNGNSIDISHIIYNGIIDFAVNEFEIDYLNLELEQARTIARRIKYNSEDASKTKLSYGFYGEVLLDLILRCFMKTSVLIARGYFYSPLENSEPKGFDAFHLIENRDKVDLWFGEAKFHQSHKTAIDSVLKKLSTSLSDDYVAKNLIALINWQDKFSHPNTKISEILSAWEQNPFINIPDEMNKHNLRLTYPILIAFEETCPTCYHNNIKDCINYIKQKSNKNKITIPATFEYRIFFIFLPMSEVKKVKERVIEWIELQKPLT